MTNRIQGNTQKSYGPKKSVYTIDYSIVISLAGGVIFVLKTGRNMLQAISWKEFLVTVGLGLAVYYGWWLIRYYPGLWKKGKDRGADRPGDG